MTWIQQTSTTGFDLAHVYGFSPVDVYAVGASGTILHWDGQTWSARDAGTASALKKIWGYSPGSVWVVGINGALLRSTDFGDTWVQIDTLNIVLGFSGNFTAIWGNSDLDFWVIENGAGGTPQAYHTTDGGNTWAASALPNAVGGSGPGWTNLHGTSPTNMVLSGVRNTAHDAIAAWNGTGFSGGNLEPEGVIAGYDSFALGPRFFTVGFVPTGPAFNRGVVVDWSQNLVNRVHDLVPTAAQFSAIWGASGATANMYAAGQAFTGPGAALAQIVALGSATQSGSWAAVPVPSGVGPLLGVWADASGYGVAVGSAGAIIAQTGYALSIAGAFAIATNRVRVTLSAPPLAQSPIVAGDALNPASWTLQRVDTGALLEVMAAEMASPFEIDLILFGRLANALVIHQVASSSLMDAFGNAISPPTSATFYGVIADSDFTQEAQAAARRFAIVDLANPPVPLPSTGLGGGVRIITASGDYKNETGTSLLKKLILRRLSTNPGEFFHLPDYGVGIRPKSTLRAGDLFDLKQRIISQVLLEPEVQAVDVSLTLDDNGVLTIILEGTTVTGQNFDVQTSTPTTIGGQ